MDKAPGKGEGEYAEAGDEAFQNQRLDAIEQFLQAQFAGQFIPAEQTEGADVVEEPPA